MLKKIIFPMMLAAVFFPAITQAQPCAGLANECSSGLAPYTSDGQYHYSLLLEQETAEFEGTFYAGGQYRVAACTGPNNDTLVFKVLDSDYNVIFSNADYDYIQYWDFKFNATDKYIIQAELKEGAGSGCAVILVGFKEE